MLKKLWDHINYWKENYLYIPFSLLLAYLAIQFVHNLTGRAVIDDPGMIVGWIFNFVKGILIVSITGLTKSHLFDDIDTTKEGVSFFRAFLDSCETIFLLIFFAYLLSH